MQNEMQLQQLVYGVMETQIKFGSLPYGSSLPTIKETSKYFCVSVDTVRQVYLRLKQAGYISLSPSIGARVSVQYSPEETTQHIQAFFVARQDTLIDLARSAQPLFLYAFWLALKTAPKEILDLVEQRCLDQDLPLPYRMSWNLLQLFRSLGNDLFLRLIWQTCLLLYAPFLSIPFSKEAMTHESTRFLHIIHLCKQKDWTTLWHTLEAHQTQTFHTMRNFYEANLPHSRSVKQIQFSWNIYKKASQVCYSLCEEILHAIAKGAYPVGSYLPPPAQFAKENKVSINTIRRSISILNKLGATQSVNGVGTKILPPVLCSKNCDFSNPIIRNRLLDFVQTFQIFALSCKRCVKLTLAAMDTTSIQQTVRRLNQIKHLGCNEMMLYICFELISLYAPYQAIRTIYTELLKQLIWGFPLGDLHGDRQSTNAYFLPYLDYFMDCLTRFDFDGFSEMLEKLQLNETDFSAKYLMAIGIKEAEDILIPFPLHQ